MICKKCGKEINPGMKFCTGCGAPVEEQAPVENVTPAPELKTEPVNTAPVNPGPAVPPVAPPVQPSFGGPQNNPEFSGPRPVDYVQPEPAQNDKPLSAWAYAGLLILYSCTCCIGWIFMLVFAFGKGGNVNRKKFSQGCFIFWIIGFVLSIAFIIFNMALFISFFEAIQEAVEGGLNGVDPSEIFNNIDWTQLQGIPSSFIH